MKLSTKNNALRTEAIKNRDDQIEKGVEEMIKKGRVKVQMRGWAIASIILLVLFLSASTSMLCTSMFQAPVTNVYPTEHITVEKTIVQPTKEIMKYPENYVNAIKIETEDRIVYEIEKKHLDPIYPVKTCLN